MTPEEKTHWIKVGIATAILAILIKTVLHIPFITIFVTVVVVYSLHIVWNKLGMKTSTLTTAWGWVNSTLSVAMGLVIFVVLRFIVAKVTNLYPVDTWEEIGKGGSFYWIVRGHNMSSIILWEILFAFIAGGLSVAWFKGKHGIVGAIFGISLLILSLQIAFPNYTATWPSREAVGTNLVHHGVAGTTLKAGWRFLWGNPTPPPPPTANSPATVAPARNLRIVPPAERPWTWQTLTIPPRGLPVYLYPGWQDSAFDGDITITTPSGRVLHDEPGANHNFGIQWKPEIYIFLADPPGSPRKVNILNRW